MLRRFTSSSSSLRLLAPSTSSLSTLVFSQQASIFSATDVDFAMKMKSFAKKAVAASSARSASSTNKKPALLAKAVAASSSAAASKKKVAVASSSKKQAPAAPQQQKPTTVAMSEKPPLNAEQQAILDFILKNPKKSVYITGSGGTGKSVLLRAIVDALPAQTTHICAPTGVAALNIGGITLHSFLRLIPDGQLDLRAHMQSKVWADVQRRFWTCQTLIIDEISMVDPSIFQAVDRLARIARNSHESFGGMQVILCGDFLQLPPVSNDPNRASLDSEENDDDGEDIAAPGQNKTKFNEQRAPRYTPPNRCNADMTSKYCFQTHEWKRLNPRVFNLTQVMRQKEPHLIDLLNKIRFGEQTDADMKRILIRPDQETVEHDVVNIDAPVRIFCRNREVNDRNRICFNALRADNNLQLIHYDKNIASPNVPRQREVVYQCATVGDARIFGKVIPKRLPLCVGARVMLLKNLDVGAGLVNGSTGVVIGFHDVAYERSQSDNGGGDDDLTKSSSQDEGDRLFITSVDELNAAKLEEKRQNKLNEKNNKSNKSKSNNKNEVEDNMSVPAEEFLITYRNNPIDKLVPIKEIYPIVKFNGVELPVVIKPSVWKQRSGGNVASKLLQLPLRHAWAITSHKAQGMTFEKVHVDLSNAFERGQAYVALSRARTIEHLKVTGYDEKRVKACEIAAEFHKNVSKMSTFEGLLLASAEGKSTKKK